MSANLKYGPTRTMTWTNATGSDVVAGEMVRVGVSLLAIAKVNIADGASGAVFIDGTFRDIAKATGQAWAEGDQLYHDAANDRLTTTSTGNLQAGLAEKAAASADTTGDFILNARAAAAIA